VTALVAAGVAVALTGCSGAKVGETAAAPAPGGTAAATCGTFNLAVNAWVGYEANAAVIAYVAQNKLGCKVVKKNLDEQVSWQGFGTGEVDAIVENWGHEDLAKKYITEQKVAQDAGPSGNIGAIGWYVTPSLVAQYPDITDHNNLNKYASLFKTSESGDQGQLLNLNYKVVYSGSEAALITSFRQAEQTKKPMIGYFYSPQWFLSEVPLVKVKLPAYTAGCDADAAKVACDYPDYTLNKVVSTKFATSGSPAYALVKKFSWTNEDQNLVAKYIAQDKMSDEDAAKKWVEANPAKVAAWLS